MVILYIAYKELFYLKVVEIKAVSSNGAKYYKGCV
jgi:hypothetical protein